MSTIRPRLPDLIVLLAAMLLFTAVVRGDDEVNPNAGPVTVSATAGAITTLAGDAGTSVLPVAFIETDGPLALGSSAIARVYARLGINSEPGEAIDLADATTFKAAEVALGAYRVIGRLGDPEEDAQVVTTSLVAEWGFSSRLGDSPEPVERLARHYGGGLRFDERKSGASLSIMYGRDEAAGDRGYGQWLIVGQVPITGTKGALVLVGDATLSVGQRRYDVRQRDILRLGVVLDVGAALEAMRR